MSPEGWAETPEETRVVIEGREWLAACECIQAARRLQMPETEQALLERMRKEFGPVLVDGLLEWLES